MMTGGPAFPFWLRSIRFPPPKNKLNPKANAKVIAKYWGSFRNSVTGNFRVIVPKGFSGSAANGL